MKTFLTIWFGQFISQIGTALTRFALLIWVYQQNQRALDVALLGFVVTLAGVARRAGIHLCAARADRYARLFYGGELYRRTDLLLHPVHTDPGAQWW